MARHPDWDSAILSPRVVDRSLKNMTIRNAVHGHNHPGRLIDGLRWETEVTPRTQKDVYGAMIDKEQWLFFWRSKLWLFSFSFWSYCEALINIIIFIKGPMWLSVRSWLQIWPRSQTWDGFSFRKLDHNRSYTPKEKVIISFSSSKTIIFQVIPVK